LQSERSLYYYSERFDRKTRELRPGPAYTAAALAVTWAVITRAVLVPVLFKLRQVRPDAAQVQPIFLHYARWSGVNDLLHVLTFALSVWALSEVLSGPSDSAVASNRQ